ncbi:hypothetical protein EST38_g6762 [Candolleomyces aberdarensis]|uniref:Pheromone n=1 Tax=Candolleomyces aberdarensis TaxID=2316362 RepID=A0A4Q2DJT8_9AGAR|nr:hypothetical protein EST38_g6762 [Candolleomyces aberdarensis]
MDAFTAVDFTATTTVIEATPEVSIPSDAEKIRSSSTLWCTIA